MVFFAKGIVVWFIVLCVGGLEMMAGHFYLRVIEPVTASRGLGHGAEVWQQEHRYLLLLQACRMPGSSILLLFASRQQFPGLLLSSPLLSSLLRPARVFISSLTG